MTIAELQTKKPDYKVCSSAMEDKKHFEELALWGREEIAHR